MSATVHSLSLARDRRERALHVATERASSGLMRFAMLLRAKKDAPTAVSWLREHGYATRVERCPCGRALTGRTYARSLSGPFCCSWLCAGSGR